MKRYIALEGIEGAGKTSVQAELRARLEAAGHEVVGVREPGGTPLGKELRRILLYGDEPDPWAEALMFAADRAHLVAEVVRPALQRGAWVISDRSVYSSLAYQGVGRGLGIDAVWMVNKPGLAGVWPDRVFLLTVGPDIGLARQARADTDGMQWTLPFIEQSTLEVNQMTLGLKATDRIGLVGVCLQSAVAEAFDELAQQDPARFVVVNAERSFDRVIADVWAALGVGS